MMNTYFSKTNSMVVYIDGACTGNPGPSAGAAVFFRPNTADANVDLGTIEFENLKYMCYSSIHIGWSTNNMAEYTGLVMALLICALNKIEHVCIRTDSNLMTM